MKYGIGDQVAYNSGINYLLVEILDFKDENYQVTILESSMSAWAVGAITSFSIKDSYWSLCGTKSEIITNKIINQLDKLENKFTLNSQNNENIF